MKWKGNARAPITVLASAALVGAATLTAGCSGDAKGAGSTAPGPAPSSSAACAEDDETGAAGSPSAELQGLERRISDVIGENDDAFAGAAYSMDYSQLYVYVVQGSDSATTLLDETIEGQPGADQVVAKPVEYSMAELVAGSSVIARQSVAGMNAVGPDVTKNMIMLGVDEAADGAPALCSEPKLSELVELSKVENGDRLADIPVRVYHGEEATPDTATN